MNKAIFIIIAISVLALAIGGIAGCPRERIYKEVEGNITFRIQERFTKEKERHIFIDLATEKIYGCYNYQLNSDVEVQNNLIIVEVKNVFIEGACLTAEGPARFRGHLGKLEGDYQFIIKHKDKEDKYDLKITKEKIILNTVFSSFTILLQNVTSRISN